MSNATNKNELLSQWRNPGDALSLLLLVGGDIVQKALAQLVGFRLEHRGTGYSLYLTPVAFSFGWVAYAFQSLMSIFGEQRLMPEPDCSVISINCRNAIIRENYSWVLGRLVRDYEQNLKSAKLSAPLDLDGQRREVSVKIDIFRAEVATDDQNPTIGLYWYAAWTIILLQQIIGLIPWFLSKDWTIFATTVCGTIFAQLTGALPQWTMEKWTSRRLRKEKIMALTRGNGRQYVMIIISPPGSLDLEAMSSARLNSRPETPWIMLVLSILWMVLLITVSGLTQHTWFLIAVGGIGMVQNAYLAAAKRSASEAKIPLRPHEICPTIVGFQMNGEFKSQARFFDDSNSEEESEGAEFPLYRSAHEIDDVMGALVELEKRIPKAGASLLTVMYDGGLQYNSTILIFNRDKKFWKRAFRRMGKAVPTSKRADDNSAMPARTELGSN